MEKYSGSSLALISESERLSYEELMGLADSHAAHMHSRALVFMKVANNVESVAFYAGCLRNHIVPLMLNADIADELWQLLFDEYRPEFVWAPSRDSALEGLRPVIADRGYVLARTGWESPTLGDELALLLSTSGSTGSPKLVRQSYANIRANAESIVEYLGIAPGDRAITTLPFGYTYGISIVNSHLMAGAAVILNDHPLMGREFWDLLKCESATTFGGVPYTYQILDKLRFERMDLPSLRYITQAGGRLGEELHRKFAEACAAMGIGFVAMYGQTEATARMSYLPAECALDKVGSIGVAIPGGTFSLLGDDGSVIEEAGVDGELVYSGPNVTLGYATCRSDLAKGDERAGVLHTGDIARRDNDGFYYITGRKGRFLKVYGNRVGLDELESILARNGITAACTGEDDHVRIYVESRSAKQAVEVAALETGLNQKAFEGIELSELPRSSAGKLRYSELT